MAELRTKKLKGGSIHLIDVIEQNSSVTEFPKVEKGLSEGFE